MFDFSLMQEALQMARQAMSQGSVPVGAIIAQEGNGIAKAFNAMPMETVSPHFLPLPLQHAELLAIILACQTLQTDRLDGCHLYVTLEPCPFCWGAIRLMHLSKVFFGAYAPSEASLPFPEIQTFGGLLEDESTQLLKEFFKIKRLI